MSDAELSLRAQIAIAQAEDNLTSWHLAIMLGEDEHTIDGLGFKVYDRLNELEVSHLARIVVELLVERQHHIRNAERILAAINTDQLAELSASTCPVCGKPMGEFYDECFTCFVAADDAYRRGQDR